jgi:hypothetical protein
MTRRLNAVFGAVVAGSLMLSSTAAVAATPAPFQQVDQWAALALLSGGAPAAAVCGSAAATGAQPAGGCVLPVADVPPPPPVGTVPPPAVVGGAGISPLFLALSAIIVGAGVWLFTTGNGENKVGTPVLVPISPT